MDLKLKGRYFLRKTNKHNAATLDYVSGIVTIHFDFHSEPMMIEDGIPSIHEAIQFFLESDDDVRKKQILHLVASVVLLEVDNDLAETDSNNI